MAENENSQEKTEEPTPRRLQKAKDDGQIPRSKELSTSLVLIVGVLSIWLLADLLFSGAKNIFQYNFVIEREQIFDEKQMLKHLGASAYEAILTMTPTMMLILLAAALAPLALGGWMFSGKALLPKANRISPLSGLKRMFGVKSLVELIKSWAKVLVVIGCTFLLFFIFNDKVLFLHREPGTRAIADSADLVMLCAFILACSTLLVSVIDVPYQIYEYMQKMRMSLQEVKDEHKETEGKPEVKQRIRRLQYEMSQRRMMDDVKDADVVITNPTHYAVALKYDSDQMGAPLMVAKGTDEVALKIREIAKQNKIAVVEAPPLARSIYAFTKIGKEIPEGLYVAVAQVLAYVYQLNQFFAGQGPRPKQPPFPVPPDLKA
ncbi:flagellar biosynthesis protein FlhB [Bermanella marisrubri]|uniref:Flagellar biosynthetic protein FlhB n=1 Tax=Bermanella marisrubri TaxID=207949 RepID=Q1N2V0_9GAMM|nr:flagellar biosynthesis protein FlhB [Bermanella marisrubri]EAT12569.1 Flagellar biosynthesis pathway, component FlhB [Oceanobacter sp. RED65] [Bermanella marisrubri]QIZ84874.1 flagellar biosynthesis protein FlhB [Bermanella marisrubri]